MRPCSAPLQSSAARALLLAKGCKTPGKRLPRARNLSCEREGGREGGREERTDGRTDGRRDGGREIMVFLIGTCLVSSYSEQCPCCPATTSRTATPACWAHAVVKAGCADPRGAKPLVRPKSSAGRCMLARRTSDAAARGPERTVRTLPQAGIYLQETANLWVAPNMGMRGAAEEMGFSTNPLWRSQR